MLLVYTDKDSTVDIPEPLSIHELTEVLIKHHNLHEGRYELLIEFKIGTGMVGIDKESLTPGAMFGVSKIGLAKSKSDGPMTVDASIINPAKKTQRRKEKTSE